jgi:DNA uptake protein ComE-like DNA-binding protein
MHRRDGTQAASLPELILIVCLVALFGTAAVQGLGGRSGSLARAQTASATSPKPQTIGQKIAASQQLLDINTATADQLKALPGMGAAYAERVIAGRPYTAKNQLATRGILPKGEYERIREMIVAHRPKQ